MKEYWNLGIGSALIELAIENARKFGYLQIELYVSVKNERAIALYEKHGFKNYGTRPRELLLDSGEFTDSYFMVLMLD
ncbi:MAG: GNAT family N-acetyltransferase [Treponema sp.]|nr:GNAT family N-acetyltransferase [Treponema sp.]